MGGGSKVKPKSRQQLLQEQEDAHNLAKELAERDEEEAKAKALERMTELEGKRQSLRSRLLTTGAGGENIARRRLTGQ